jgi:hypothetical protein
MVSITSRIKSWFGKEAAQADSALSGAPVVRFNQPYGFVDRSTVITPDRIAANRSIPVVLESLSGLSRLCFSGFTHVLQPLDSSDDKQGPNIEKAMAQIRLQEKRIGRVGKARNMGTLGLVRASALDGWSFRQALAEYATVQEGGWLNFAEVQHLPAQSFSTASSLAGNDYLADKILPGVVFDSKQDITRFFQYSGSGQAVELEPDGILYIEDVTVPDDISFLKVLMPTMEAWKEVRRYGMTAEKRVAVPNETERVDASDIVKMITAKIPVKVQDLIDHCDDLAENQSYANKKVAIPGTRIEYPSISMPLNPWEADAYLKKEIIDFFFKRDILEVTAQAISATNAPAKELLDIHIASERELWGKPYESLWNQWLEWNGFELVDEFAWWDWTPKDQQAAHARNLENFRSHAMTIQTFCELEGLPIPSEEPGKDGKSELDILIEQHDRIFGNKGAEGNVLNPSSKTV